MVQAFQAMRLLIVFLTVGMAQSARWVRSRYESNNHQTAFVRMCVKRRRQGSTRYMSRNVRRDRVNRIQDRGGGYIGDPVPGYEPGYVFDDRCQPYLKKAAPVLPPPPDPVEYDCEQCPCGWYDGCNFCNCGSPPTGPAACTLKFCETLTEPRCDPCPSCDADVYTCPDGTVLSRDQYNDCEFPECPQPPPGPELCCDPYEKPTTFACFEGIECCPNTGLWSCSIGDGTTYPCGDVTITGDYGEPCGCPEDLRMCPDGSQVKRDPLNYCEFAPCDGKPPPKCCDPEEQPGVFGNPICKEGAACCPDGTWSCSIGDAKSFPCGGEIITSGFGEPCDDPPAKCCDPLKEPGQLGNDFCFEGSACCPDGTWACGSIGDGKTFSCGGVLIDSGFGEPCPLDCEICPGGFYDGCNTCGCDPDRPFPLCTLRACGPEELEPKRCNQEAQVCTQELSTCPDGSEVGRDPNNDCAFFPCPTESCCDPDERPGVGGGPICTDGSFCCEDCCSWTCGIGDGSANCEAVCSPPPPTEFCTQDVKTCPDGSFVGRDPNSGCAFFPCPEEEETCCDPDERPGVGGGPICTDGAFCCEDCCSWTCGIGDGSANCEAVCSPPPPTEFCTQDVKTCPDGSFVGRDPNSGCAFFPCPVETCCDPDERPGVGGGPFCTDGAFCCEDCCTWTCGIGDGTANCDTTCSSEEDEVGCDTCECGYNDGCNDCECYPDGSVACTERYCVWEGIPSCRECRPLPPTEFCTQDVQSCPDGSFVGRDPNNGCAFFPCPEETCCDPEERPGFGGSPMCADGSICCEECCTWSCGIGNGSFGCENVCNPY